MPLPAPHPGFDFLPAMRARLCITANLLFTFLTRDQCHCSSPEGFGEDRQNYRASVARFDSGTNSSSTYLWRNCFYAISAMLCSVRSRGSELANARGFYLGPLYLYWESELCGSKLLRRKHRLVALLLRLRAGLFRRPLPFSLARERCHLYCSPYSRF